jgi:aminoglycoside phosphotransferase (APT) family kinase protein
MVSPAPLELATVLSPAWLDAVLGARFPGVRVARTEIVEQLRTIAAKVRFRVEYEANPSGAPEALCVKGYFAPERNTFASVGRVEARFYADLASCLQVRIPPSVHAGVDEDSGHGLVLMEDLIAGGCSFLTPLSPYGVEQTAATLGELARLHTVDSLAVRARDTGFLAPRLKGHLDYIDRDQLQAQLDDGRAEGLPAGLRSADRLRAGFEAIADRSASRATSLVHGDAHAGNLYLDAAGQPGLIDWQVVQWGAWEIDVAYHIAAVLEPGDRARHERALLGHYLEAARSHGGEPPPPDEAWELYRRALVYGYFMWAITRRVERPILETFVRRLGAAVAAHDALDRLGV